MEPIRKKICFDDFLSYRDGLMPYNLMDNTDNSIKYAKTPSDYGNYNSFPCDLVITNYTESTTDELTGLPYRNRTELSRLRYMDIIHWYNESLKSIDNGFVLKRVTYKETPETLPINCSNRQSANSTTKKRWVRLNNIDKSIFECYMVDSAMLKKVEDFYYYDEINTLKKNKIDLNNATEEEIEFVEKVNYFIGNNGNGGILFTNGNDYDYIYVVDNYDTLKKYDDLWDEWWSTSTSYNSLKNYLFGNDYSAPKDFIFVYDMETYIIGKVRVPKTYNSNEIKGEKVPHVVYYLDYLEYQTWFELNKNNVNNDEELKKEWDRRGGNAFWDFLKYGITPKFINWDKLNSIPTGDTTVVECVYQNIELGIPIIQELSDEKMYMPYEYSMNFDNTLIDATMPYKEGARNQIESALTPDWERFQDASVVVESQLNRLFDDETYYVNENVYGVFENFNSSGGQLFSCNFYRENSSGEFMYYYSGMVLTYMIGADNLPHLYGTKRIPQTNENHVDDIPPLTKEDAYTVLTRSNSGNPITPPTFDSTETITGSVYTVGNFSYYDVSAVTHYHTKKDFTWEWCECIPIDESTALDQGIVCADGENINFNYGKNGEKKYRNILILQCAMSLSEDTSPGSKYYYMAKYDNGYVGIGAGVPVNAVGRDTKLLKIPYTKNKIMNIESYSGEYSGTIIFDKVLTVTHPSSNKAEITYVIGATSGVSPIAITGIHYKDEYDYNSGFVTTVIDGMYDVDILYESIKPINETVVYSDDLRSERTAVLSQLTSMEVCTQWTSGSSVRTYLFTEDSSENLIEYPNISVDISFNRGNASAFEKHFKLAECNSFEDVENYGNGELLK